MQITACLPFARCFRVLRFLRVFRGWDRVLRFFFNPDRQTKAPLNFDFAGISYPWSTAYLVDWSAFFNGAYEKPWLEYCLSHLENPGEATVLDIGGNIGHHALWFAAHGCTVHTFEPNAVLWPEIERKSAVPGLTGSISLHRTAMGAADETKSFMLPAGVNQGTGSFEHQPYNWGGERVEVRVSAASDYLDAQGIVAADLIKKMSKASKRMLSADCGVFLRGAGRCCGSRSAQRRPAGVSISNTCGIAWKGITGSTSPRQECRF